jgi:uncharacterized membrane protein YhiD involved in acid resistance
MMRSIEKRYPFASQIVDTHPGITTAASVWLAAAVGVGAGGALYAVTAYSVSLYALQKQ